MCVIQDECVLLAMLVLELLAGLPVMALMKMCGVAYAVLSTLGAVLSLSLAFVSQLRWCCGSLAAFVNEYGIAFFLLVHSALLSLVSFAISQFARPFLKTADFAGYCVSEKLDDNLSHTGCERLQGFYAVSLAALPVAGMAALYLLLLGSRITRRHWAQHERLLKHDVC